MCSRQIWFGLFMFRPITLKQLNTCNEYVQLTRWLRGNAPDCGAIGHGVRFPALVRMFMFSFWFFGCCGFTLCLRNTLFTLIFFVQI